MFITHQQNLMAFWDSARETLAEGIFYTKRQIKIQILRHRIRGYQADIDRLIGQYGAESFTSLDAGDTKRAEAALQRAQADKKFYEKKIEAAEDMIRKLDLGENVDISDNYKRVAPHHFFHPTAQEEFSDLKEDDGSVKKADFATHESDFSSSASSSAAAPTQGSSGGGSAFSETAHLHAASAHLAVGDPEHDLEAGASRPAS